MSDLTGTKINQLSACCFCIICHVQ